MSFRYRLGIAGVLAATLSMSGCSQPQSAPESPPASVGVYTVTSEPYTVTETLPGRTRAYMTSEVRPQIEGIIEKRLFTEGSTVEAGDVLYLIDDSRYQARVEQSQAELEQSRAAVKSAQPQADRYTALAKIDAISRQDRDNAVAQLAQDKANVATARANLKTARINLGYTRIKAPISGRIGASAVTPGALVTTNQSDPLTTINQLDPIYVDIQQSVGQYLRLKQAVANGTLETDEDDAAPVLITPEGAPDTTLTGTLEFSGVTVDQDTGAVTLRAIVPNPDHTLLPGMYVRAKLTQGIDVQSILVPQQAVQRNAGGEAVALVLDDDQTVARRQLSIAAATDDNRWRVTQGLSPGDRVIVQGIGKARVGKTVRPTAVTVNADGELQSVESHDTRASERAAASERS